MEVTCSSVNAVVHYLKFWDLFPFIHKKNIQELKIRPIIKSTSRLPALVTVGHFPYRGPSIWIFQINLEKLTSDFIRIPSFSILLTSEKEVYTELVSLSFCPYPLYGQKTISLEHSYSYHSLVRG